MEGPDPGRPRADADAFTVADPEQARLLSDPRFQAAMRPFLAREASASAAAAELGLDLNAMLYRIRLLLAAGLLRVVREEKRDGKLIRREVIIPHHDTLIEREDHVIVFCTHKNLVRKVEKLFQVGFTFL